ncbi:MAG TPA: WbqC family protein [Casimicrobiaceae bacterium]|nr:WbqC family protein [Casimicrobiaceae bacterium]
MKLAIMQPYFLPYIGYFQLIAAVDLFIVYDDIKYTKKGWINRNRMLRNGEPAVFSLPLRHGSDALDIREREIAATFAPEKLLLQFAGAYRGAPHYAETRPLLEAVLGQRETNLFRFLHGALVRTCEHLGIRTPIRISSSVPMPAGLRSEARVLALCEAIGATTYINPIGGTELYARETFRSHGIDLKFLRTRPLPYAQSAGAFVPWLSIVDVLMFNRRDAVQTMLRSGYDLV